MEEFYKSVMEDAKSKEKKVTVVSLMTSAVSLIALRCTCVCLTLSFFF